MLLSLVILLQQDPAYYNTYALMATDACIEFGFDLLITVEQVAQEISLKVTQYQSGVSLGKENLFQTINAKICYRVNKVVKICRKLQTKSV